MKRFVSTLAAWIILMSATYILRGPIASPLSGTAIGYWQIETFTLHFIVSPFIFLITWGLWIKHVCDMRLYYYMKAAPVQPNIIIDRREEVTEH